MKSHVENFHDPAFDPLIAEIRKFGADELGMQFLPPDRITVVPFSVAEQLRAKYPTFGGGYDTVTHRVLALERRVEGKLLTSKQLLPNFLLHEGAHSASYNPAEHYFFTEAIAGLAEHEYLNRQRPQTPESFTLVRAGVEVSIPGSFRYADATEFKGEPTRGARGLHSSQALIAAAGIVPLLSRIGLTEREVLGRSKLGGDEHFDAMKEALHAYQPGLVEKIGALPGNVDGVVRALSYIQTTAD